MSSKATNTMPGRTGHNAANDAGHEHSLARWIAKFEDPALRAAIDNHVRRASHVAPKPMHFDARFADSAASLAAAGFLNDDWIGAYKHLQEADVHAKNADGQTLLNIAADAGLRTGEGRFVCRLLQRGATLDDIKPEDLAKVIAHMLLCLRRSENLLLAEQMDKIGMRSTMQWFLPRWLPEGVADDGKLRPYLAALEARDTLKEMARITVAPACL